MKTKKNYSSFDVIPTILNVLTIISIIITIYYLIPLIQNGASNDYPLPFKISFLCVLAFHLIEKFIAMAFAPSNSRYYKVKLLLLMEKVSAEMALSIKEHGELIKIVYSKKRDGELIDYKDICNIARLIKKL